MSVINSKQQYMVRTTQGAEFGPANLEQLRIWAGEGRVGGEDLIITSASDPPVAACNWPPLREYLRLTGGGEGIATLIPFRNKCALIGYYLGIFGLIPFLGVPLAIAAIILGFMGLRYRNRHPEAHGTAHAIVAIICGAIGLLLTLLIFVLPYLLAK